MNDILVSHLPATTNGRNGHAPGNGKLPPNGFGGPSEKTRRTVANGQAHELTSLFLSAARHLLAVNDDLAAELPLRQMRVCMMLYAGPRSMSSLGRELGVSLSAMTQIADRLERARLVKRSLEGKDRRVRCLRLTPRGQKIMRLREEARLERAVSVMDQLPPEERKQVLGALRMLLGACPETEELAVK